MASRNDGPENFEQLPVKKARDTAGDGDGEVPRLPEDILRKVFEMSPNEDRLEVSQVSKSFRECDFATGRRRFSAITLSLKFTDNKRHEIIAEWKKPVRNERDETLSIRWDDSDERLAHAQKFLNLAQIGQINVHTGKDYDPIVATKYLDMIDAVSCHTFRAASIEGNALSTTALGLLSKMKSRGDKLFWIRLHWQDKNVRDMEQRVKSVGEAMRQAIASIPRCEMLECTFLPEDDNGEMQDYTSYNLIEEDLLKQLIHEHGSVSGFNLNSAEMIMNAFKAFCRACKIAKEANDEDEENEDCRHVHITASRDVVDQFFEMAESEPVFEVNTYPPVSGPVRAGLNPCYDVILAKTLGGHIADCEEGIHGVDLTMAQIDSDGEMTCNCSLDSMEGPGRMPTYQYFDDSDQESESN